MIYELQALTVRFHDTNSLNFNDYTLRVDYWNQGDTTTATPTGTIANASITRETDTSYCYAVIPKDTLTPGIARVMLIDVDTNTPWTAINIDVKRRPL